MSITAKLYIEGHSKEHKGGIPMVSYSLNFSQSVNEDGYVSSKVRAGLIHVSIRGTEDPEIIHWMLSNSEAKNGRIEFSGFDPEGTGGSSHKRKLLFKDAMLVDYSESFNELSDITINMALSARHITIGNEQYISFWSSKFDAT
jgi:hypothetical protein